MPVTEDANCKLASDFHQQSTAESRYRFAAMSLGRIVIHITCTKCGRAVKIEQHRIAPDFRTGQLRCRDCGQRAATIQLVWHQGPPPPRKTATVLVFRRPAS